MVRESDTGEDGAILWVADSRNACIRQLVIDDDSYADDPGEGAEAEVDGRPQSQPSRPSPSAPPRSLPPSQRPATSPGFLETGGPSPVAVRPHARPAPRFDVPVRTKVVACWSLVGGAAARDADRDADRDAEEGEHADPMRRGNDNGTFEAATLEQPVKKGPYRPFWLFLLRN